MEVGMGTTAELARPDLARSRRTRTTGQPTSRFRGDIEGLRAVAVLLVVAYHAGIGVVSGGFVGRRRLLRAVGVPHHRVARRRGRPHRLHLDRGFYARRIRRLLPLVDPGAGRDRGRHVRLRSRPSTARPSPATSPARRCGAPTGSSPPSPRSTWPTPTRARSCTTGRSASRSSSTSSGRCSSSCSSARPGSDGMPDRWCGAVSAWPCRASSPSRSGLPGSRPVRGAPSPTSACTRAPGSSASGPPWRCFARSCPRSPSGRRAARASSVWPWSAAPRW